MQSDIIILTDRRWIDGSGDDWFLRQVCHEDGLVAAALADLGHGVTRRPWDEVDVSAPPCTLLFRSTWDYFDRFAAFSPWLDRVAGHHRLFNDAGLLRWNLDKHYLGILAATGLPVLPTRYLDAGSSLEAAIAESPWDEMVIKPVVSGSARHTHRFLRADARTVLDDCTAVLATESMMLQPFARNVTTDGELSLIVIDGKTTHAVRKIPKDGDFRVQDEHGGRVVPHIPTREEQALAERAVAAVPFDVLYARVDLVRDNDGHPALMELEMIEPELFFRFEPDAARQLATGLSRRLTH